MTENNDIPEMNLNNNYSKLPNSMNAVGNTSHAQKEIEKTKKELEKIKNFVVKKYPFVQSISILPQQAIKLFIDEEELGMDTQKMSKENIDKISKKIHLQVIIPEEKFKEISKIRNEIVKQIDTLKQDVWVHIKTPVDVWEICLDSKFELAEAIGMSFPLYDKGFLGALRVAEIHKSLVLQKFERYVVSYVIGGSVVRGDAIKTSDVDVFIVINDTDVKRMPRLELKERLRSMIYQYVNEASALAGVKNKLSPQVYLLTEFWDSVKDANPVMFTFIRDGIPIYDRGTFMPWKALLKMGKLKPSPESIDMFMKTADKTKEMADRRLVDAMVDIYYGVLTPSQALIMLYGLPPPTPKETAKKFEEIFVTKEKMLKKTEIAILEKAVREFKAYEHDLKYTIKGSEIDKMKKDAEDFFKRLKQLREQIEKIAQERTINQIYNDVFGLLENIFGKKSRKNLTEEFKKDLVNTGKFPPSSISVLESIVRVKNEFQKGKSNSHKIDSARKNASLLINDLIDYSQRKDLMAMEKNRFRLKYNEGGKNKIAELVLTGGESFLVIGNRIKKITNKISDSSLQEFSNAVAQSKAKKEFSIEPKVFELVKKEIGKFEIVL
ncbi:hypothetical protein COU59_02865 [Candidatus Pacearchaeota archaeon CG10_big_fil_rev_8_21_14_0_10_34_12]|nr:MAG: hypothetical protein COU59_02865 [Candidatus Pacearchaeota archaeon CG10_big_fil_rev_8_21_14_0_10_34_12]